MELFLKEAARNLKSEENCPWIVVTGNEACDLDSTVCAMAYAFFKQLQVGKTAVVIPLCYINRADMPLRSEIMHWLDHCHVRWDVLIYADDLFPAILRSNSCEKQLILVDHNKVTGRLADMNWSVIEVIDHHQLESADNQLLSSCLLKRIERVGSCATLITELLLQSDHAEHIPPCVWELLYGAILIDTIGLSVRGQKAGRLTDLDLLMATRIEDRIGYKIFNNGASRESLFVNIENAKFNVDGMSTWDLLRRDTKLARGAEESGDCFVCSTVSGLDIVTLVCATDFVEMANRLCALHSSSVLVCITVGRPPAKDDQVEGDQHKGLAVYSPTGENALCKELVKFLCNPKHELDLRMKNIDQAPVVFSGLIHNPRVTRKTILPILVEFINGHQSPPTGGSGTAAQRATDALGASELSDLKTPYPDSKSYPIRSLDPTIQNELDYLRSWLASFEPEKRFELVYTTVSRVLDLLNTHHPSVELLKQVTIQLTEQARADKDFAAKYTAVPVIAEQAESGTGSEKTDTSIGDLVLSDIGKALNRGRRSTMPATHDLMAYHASKQKKGSKLKYRGASDDSYSLPDQENTKPSWLETEYLTRLRSWLPDHIPKNSAEAVEAVSYRLYRRLSSVPHDGRLRPPDFSTSELESADDSFSEPMDDAELALLRTSFADMHALYSSGTVEENSLGDGQTNSSSLLPSTSWPFTPQDTVVQRGLEWLRRSPKVSHLGSRSKPTTPNQSGSPRATHGHVTFMGEIEEKYLTDSPDDSRFPGETSTD